MAEHAGELREAFCDEDRQLVLRVDRTDPSKNIVRGFQAFSTMLEDHPELAGKVSFLALLQPSRQDVPEYADYLAEIGATVARVNAATGPRATSPSTSGSPVTSSSPWPPTPSPTCSWSTPWPTA